MSDIKDQFLEELEKVSEVENLKSDTDAKKAKLDNKLVTNKLTRMEEDEKDLELARNADYGALSPERIAQIQEENDAYMEAAKFPLPFICETFNHVIPFFRKNFILIGARTGEGKSTAVANIAFAALAGKSNKTGKCLRILVLTNEERAEDFYNRVTAISRNWPYTSHSKFTDIQRAEFRKMIPILASGGRLTVIDNNHGGSHGVTTSIEGIEGVFDNLIEKQEYYDIVLIDYYQNIISSKKNPGMSINDVQARLANAMDKYKNTYPAPIVMFAQLTPPDKDDKVPFQYRIAGRKIILNPATCAIEMVADRVNKCTKWVIHKSRFTEYVGEYRKTGYDKGKFVPYTDAFALEVQKAAYRAHDQKINQSIGIPDAFDKKEENKDGQEIPKKTDGS